MRDGYESEIRIHRPKNVPENGSPLIVLIFGGGFFMDDYILAFPSLEMLLCPHLSYTPLLISRLPHTLSTLALRTGIGEPFDSDNYAAALQLRSGHLHALSELVLDTNGGKPEYPSLAAVCTREGISFRIVERNHFNPFLSPDRDFQ